jgi:hypothetical protein
MEADLEKNTVEPKPEPVRIDYTVVNIHTIFVKTFFPITLE